MKGKMYKYIFSLLLLFVVLSGNSQTINGRLYTQFNNYYKWRGGAFDSVLLLPNLTATAGLRGGALRYSGSDSSLYVWTGFQWRKIDGGGSTDTTSLSNRINLKLNISDTSTMLANYLLENVAAATYQPIGDYLVLGTHGSLQSLTITGTNGNGNIHLRHQSSLPTATGQSTVIYANSNGDFAYKNDGNYHTTFVTSANTQDRSYTFQNKSYTVADNAEVMKYIDTVSLSDRINAITPGVQWTGVDSSFAYSRAVNGYHELEDFVGIGAGLTSPSNFAGSRFGIAVSSGNYSANNITGITGSITLSTSTNASGAAAVSHLSAGSPAPTIQPLTQTTVFATRIRVPTLNDGTDRFYCFFGVQDATGAAQYYGPSAVVNGIGFYYDLSGTATGSTASANWQTMTANTSSRTWTTTSTSVASNTWVILQIVFTSGRVLFYIDGNLVATHTTNIPATWMYPQVVIRKTNGTNSITVNIDYITIDRKY